MTDVEQGPTAGTAEGRSRQGRAARWWAIGLTCVVVASWATCVSWSLRPSTDNRDREVIYALWGRTAEWWSATAMIVGALALVGLLALGAHVLQGRLVGRARVATVVASALVLVVATAAVGLLALMVSAFVADAKVVTRGHDRVVLVDDSFVDFDGGRTVWVGTTGSMQFVKEEGLELGPIVEPGSCRLERQGALVLNCGGDLFSLTPAGD